MPAVDRIPDDLFATFREAHNLGAHKLAHRWLDVSRHPVRGDTGGVLVPSTPATELDQVATMAALAGWLTDWLPISIHRALLAGATVDDVAAASGLDPAEVAARWREWSDGQRHIQTVYPNLFDHTDEYDQVAEILAAVPANEEASDAGR